MKSSFKKITMLIFHRERKAITRMLQEIGVVHLEVDKQFRDEDVERLERKKNNIHKALEALEDHETKGQRSSASDEKVEDIVKRILDLKHKIETNVLNRETLRKDKLQRMPWGDFELEKVQQLANYGVEVRFCIAPKKEFKKFDFGTYTYDIIYESADQVYFVVMSKGEISLPFESVKVPEVSLKDLSAREKQIEEENSNIQKVLAGFVRYIPFIRQELVEVEDQLAFAVAQGSYKKYGEGSILSLTGWFPTGMEEKLIEYVKKQEIAYRIEAPGPESKVPVLLRNKRYSSLFEPITKIFELPNYYELDLTPLIAVFYPIMFAYCLGDAGYGLIFLGASLVGLFTFLKKEKKLAMLGIILGFFTTVMGIVKSGSVFGMPTAMNDSWVLFQYLEQYIIVPDDRDFVFNAFNVSLLIGVVQIFTGIIISIINKLKYEGGMAALPQIGKFLIVAGLIWLFLADMQGVEVLQPLPLLRQIFLVAGVLLVLFFHDMSLSVVSRAASGLLPLFFIVTGILGDILSYVRLFALGVASSVLGLVVNQIGMQIMGDSWIGIIIGVAFLIFGHTLNFFIAILGSFVHPLRLTFVEFYNNALFKGGGEEYRPFRKESLDTNN